jgi:hypothetical protein
MEPDYKKGPKAPSFKAGMNGPLCWTNHCSSEYPVFAEKG